MTDVLLVGRFQSAIFAIDTVRFCSNTVGINCPHYLDTRTTGVCHLLCNDTTVRFNRRLNRVPSAVVDLGALSRDCLSFFPVGIKVCRCFV